MSLLTICTDLKPQSIRVVVVCTLRYPFKHENNYFKNGRQLDVHEN